MDEKDYQKHFDYLTSQESYKSISHQQIEEIWNRLLSFLPNDGKLYKYKSGVGESFDHIYESLKKEYIYLPNPTELNDKVDTTLHFDLKSEKEKAMNFFAANNSKVLKTILEHWMDKEDVNKKLTRLKIQILDYYDDDKKSFDKTKAVWFLIKNGYDIKTSNVFLNEFKDEVENLYNNNPGLFEELWKRIISINDLMRKEYQIYSLCEDYQQDSLWAYYGANNEGFCIEYDFNNIRKYDDDIKRVIMYLFKVRYNDQKEMFDLEDVIEHIYVKKKDHEHFVKVNRAILDQLLVKSNSWEHEKEWRLVVSEQAKKYPVNLVSRIFIDESMVDKENGKKLIELCHDKRWPAVIRKLGGAQSYYEYVDENGFLVNS